jgi:hypothetical protein
MHATFRELYAKVLLSEFIGDVNGAYHEREFTKTSRVHSCLRRDTTYLESPASTLHRERAIRPCVFRLA